MAQARQSSDREARERLRVYTVRKRAHERTITRRRRDNVLSVLLGLLLVGAAITAQVLFVTVGPGKPLTDANGVPLPTLAEDSLWDGTLSLNEVELGIELDGEAAPQGVSSFLYLAQAGFYDGLSCHRLTTGEEFGVLQCGDPAGDGSGGPGYSYGPIENAPEDEFYPAGTIAMARQSDNATSAGSQFFIVYQDTTIPNDSVGGYTVLGTVTSGLEDLRTSITDAGVIEGAANPADGTPAVPVTITGVTVDKRVQ